MPYDSLKTLTQDAAALIEAIRAFHVRCAQDLAKAAQTEAELRREIAALKGEKEPLVWPKLDDEREQGVKALDRLMATWGASASLAAFTGESTWYTNRWAENAARSEAAGGNPYNTGGCYGGFSLCRGK